MYMIEDGAGRQGWKEGRAAAYLLYTFSRHYKIWVVDHSERWSEVKIVILSCQSHLSASFTKP